MDELLLGILLGVLRNPSDSSPAPDFLGFPSGSQQPLHRPSGSGRSSCKGCGGLAAACVGVYISVYIYVCIYIYDNMYKHYKLVYKLSLLCGAEFGWVSHHCCGCQDSHFLQQLGHSQWFSLVFEVKAAEEHGVLLAELHESLGAVVAETGRGRALLG